MQEVGSKVWVVCSTAMSFAGGCLFFQEIMILIHTATHVPCKDTAAGRVHDSRVEGKRRTPMTTDDLNPCCCP